MKHTITKGRQRGAPLLWDVWLTSNPRIKYEIVFGDNCHYNLVGDSSTMQGDDFDINKLVGFGFFNFNKWPPHHYESVRVGWRWNSENSIVDLYTYRYELGKRIIIYLTSVRKGMPIVVEMSASNKSYEVSIECRYTPHRGNFSHIIDRKTNYPISYLLGPYFGGNRKAPHNMDIFITKLP